MNLSMIPERGSAPVHRLVRWLLLGLIAAGLIGMHVLSEQNAGGGHGMVMDGHNASAVTAQPASAIESHHHAMDMTSSSSVASAGLAAWLSAPANQGMSGSMAMCLLFLAAGAATIALILLARRIRRSTADLAARLTASWNFSRRGPPPSPPPPHSLCILRV